MAPENNNEALLTGLRIMVTRPRNQAEPFCRRIEAAGGRVIRLPVIEIGDPLAPRRLDCLIDRLSHFDIAIFVSANAATRALACIRARDKGLSSLKLAAIGRKTAATLAEGGYPIDICPAREFTSEALLDLDAMQAVRGRRIVIFRGEGGRELLAETLEARGATVEYAEVYRRMIPWVNARRLELCLDQRAVDLVTITSAEGLNNLDELCGPAHREVLRRIPSIVGGSRMLQTAREMGFAKATTARDPSDEAMFDAVASWTFRRVSDQAVSSL